MFPYNGGNRLESKSTHIFRPLHEAAEPGAKSAVSDCIVLGVAFYPV